MSDVMDRVSLACFAEVLDPSLLLFLGPYRAALVTQVRIATHSSSVHPSLRASGVVLLELVARSTSHYRKNVMALWLLRVATWEYRYSVERLVLGPVPLSAPWMQADG